MVGIAGWFEGSAGLKGRSFSRLLVVCEGLLETVRWDSE